MPLLPKGLNRFVIASLLPALCLALGAIWGGTWPLMAILAISVLVFGLDRYIPEPASASEGNGAHLSRLIGFAHVPLLTLCVWSVGRVDTTFAQDLLLIFAAGLYFGQVSNSNAHELIHRGDHLSQRLGVWSYATLLNGHHVSAHRLVHHVHAATHRDPNTARLGEGFWRYALRASVGAFHAGYTAERRRNYKGRHPYVRYLAISAVSLLGAFFLGGLAGFAALHLISLHALFQILLSDYVQHYGLQRRTLPDGTSEPMGDQHSWNAPHWYSAAMLLNAPRHSDHHTRPGKSFTELTLDEDMPTLPQSLPLMCTLALFPTFWRRVMDPRVDRVRGQSNYDPTISREAALVLLGKGGLAGQSQGTLTGYAYEKTRPLPLSPQPGARRPRTDGRV